MAYRVDLAPGQNPHVNYEPSSTTAFRCPPARPNSPPEIRGALTGSVIERRNDYVQARARYCTMLEVGA